MNVLPAAAPPARPGAGTDRRRRLAEHPAPYTAAHHRGHEARAGHPGIAAAPAARDLPTEQELTAAWLLGRIPERVLPWPVVLRPGRAGRGAGPDICDAAVPSPLGVPVAGDVEVHIRASDFARHGHATDPAYSRLVCHLVWVDDRGEAGTPLSLPGGGVAPTVALAPAFRGAVTLLRAAIARGPRTVEPCVKPAGPTITTDAADASAVIASVRHEGQLRLAERAWHAQALAAQLGWDGAWTALLQHALAASAGRRATPGPGGAADADRLAAFAARLGAAPLRTLAAHTGAPRSLMALLQIDGLGTGRAAEIGWNAALPLLAALARAHDDTRLARAVAALVAAWPAPRPYGRTRALATLLGPAPERHGALYAQGLLRMHELWCTRGGCGACPLSAGRTGGADTPREA